MTVILSCRRPLRFGPDPDRPPYDPIEKGNELARIVRETIERMRSPLWFWQEREENTNDHHGESSR